MGKQSRRPNRRRRREHQADNPDWERAFPRLAHTALELGYAVYADEFGAIVVPDTQVLEMAANGVPDTPGTPGYRREDGREVFVYRASPGQLWGGVIRTDEMHPAMRAQALALDEFERYLERAVRAAVEDNRVSVLPPYKALVVNDDDMAQMRAEDPDTRGLRVSWCEPTTWLVPLNDEAWRDAMRKADANT